MKIRIALLVALASLFLLAACPLWSADAPSAPETSALAAFPKVGQYEVLRGDFHIHTVNSDGRLTARERVYGALEAGYDAIAITDHGNFRADRFTSQLAQMLGMVAVRGMETGVEKKLHVVALGFSADYEPRDSHRWADKPGEPRVYYQAQMHRVAQRGGLLVIAHPSRNELVAEALRGIEQGLIVGIEVRNSGTSYPHAFDWALEHDLAIFANSDVHHRRSRVSPMYTLVFVKERSPEGVLEAIRARRTAAMFDGMVWGRKELLSGLLKAMVSVERVSVENGKKDIRIQSRGPVALKAVLQGNGAPKEPVEIAPHQEKLVGWKDAPATVTIRWENLWTSSKDRLELSYSFN